MYALLDKDNIIVGWCWENELLNYKDFNSIQMKVEYGLATVGGKWDGQKFIHPIDLSIE